MCCCLCVVCRGSVIGVCCLSLVAVRCWLLFVVLFAVCCVCGLLALSFAVRCCSLLVFVVCCLALRVGD